MKLERMKKYFTPVRVLLAAEAALLLGCICLYGKPLTEYQFSGTDLTGDGCFYAESSDGQETYSCLDAEQLGDESADPSFLYLTTPYLDLPGGSYRVSIFYETDEEGQKYSVTSKYRTYSVVAGHERIRLPAGEQEASFSFFTPIRAEEYQVHVDYSGSGRLAVKGISICETNAWKNQLLFYVLLFSLLADGAVWAYHRLPSASRQGARLTWTVILFLTVFSSAPVLTCFIPN